MFALQRKKKNVSDTPDDLQSFLWNHEIRTNQLMNILMISIFLIIFSLLIALRFQIIYYDHSVSLIPQHCYNTVLLAFTIVFITATEGKNRYCKLLIVLSLVFVAYTLNTHYISAHLVYMLPLLVCIAYRDKRLVLLTAVMIIIVSFISEFVSVYNGIINYNILNLIGLSDGTVMVDMTIDEMISKTLRDDYTVFFVFFMILTALAYLITTRGLDLMKQKAAADKSRFVMDRELTVASEIQKGMLPAGSYDHQYCSVSASMKAAKTVGGDFYDYFMYDDRHVTVLIADVSGKGVPASLFMASAKTMIHSYAMRGRSPADVFDVVNRSLCESNPEKMFITAWMGTLDLETGRLTYVNAGHNPPFMIRHDSAVEMINSQPNFILGRKKGIRYKDHRLDMSVGDRLFLYTDGVTEAMDRKQAMYTAERLQEALGTLSSESPKEIIDKVSVSVDTFVGGADQSDDMTMVLLDYKGTFVQKDDPGKTFTLNRGTYPEVISYITGRLKESGCIEKIIRDIEICSSEILSNIDMYAYMGRGDGEVNVSVNMNESSAKVIFTDFGPEYNPLKHSNPDSEKRISEHKIGGFGILIVKKMMDDVHYERNDGKNILTIKKEF